MLPDAQAIVDALPENLLLVRPDGIVVGGNAAAGRLIGYDTADLAGRSLFEMIEDPAGSAPAYLRRCAASLQPLPGTLFFRATAGTRIESHCEGARIRLGDGAAGPILLRCRPKREALSQFTILNAKIADLTREIVARREAEDQLRLLNDVLEQRVADEVAQRMVAEEALRQAHKMEAIGQLTGGIAHDFNNILHVILGNLDAFRRRAATGELRPSESDRLVTIATQAAERAATLTQRLLAFGRRQPLKPTALDANRLVAGMSDLLHRTLGERISVEAVLSDGLWLAMADANQLENALLNLALNSRDAMPGGGKLVIETANVVLDQAYAAENRDVRPGHYVMVAVSDAGTGMSKEAIEKAFDPFFTTKGIGQGTGLGLSQVYGFIKQSGGHVRIYSEPGAGTTVKLYLPRVAAEAPPPDEPGPERAFRPGSTHELVLLVEDDPDVRANTAEMLSDLGYGVLTAPDGPTALRLLQSRGDVRLLLTDVGLPGGLNGRQLAEEVRHLYPEIRVLFTTGYARNAIVLHGRLEPGIELLTKPFSLPDLAAKLRDVLER